MRTASLLLLALGCATTPDPTTLTTTTTTTTPSETTTAALAAKSKPTWAWQRCSEPVSALPRTGDGAHEATLRTGFATTRRPEVGQLVKHEVTDAIETECTATLVADNVVITAAHCASRGVDVGNEFFEVVSSDGAVHYYGVDRYWLVPSTTNAAIEDRLGDDDIALARLSTSVPSSVATPARLADRGAAEGEQVEQFGYGCTDRKTFEGTGTKRVRAFIWASDEGRPSVGCPGDSGGPLFVGDNSVFAVHSGGKGTVFGRVDFQGAVVAHRAELQRQIAAWAKTTTTTTTTTKLAKRTAAPSTSKCGDALREVLALESRAICADFACADLEALEQRFAELRRCNASLGASEELHWLLEHPHDAQCGVTPSSVIDDLEEAGLSVQALQLFEDPARLNLLTGGRAPWFLALRGARLKYIHTGERAGARVLVAGATDDIAAMLIGEAPGPFHDRLASDLQCAVTLDAALATGGMVPKACGAIW